MADPTRFTIGCPVSGSDGPCGELRRIVLDPSSGTVTHLVVESKHRRHNGRLVPVELVESVGKDIVLSCTRAQVGELEPAEETQFLPGADDLSGYGVGELSALPYYGLRAPGLWDVGSMTAMGTPDPASKPISRDRVPPGEVQVKRGDPVHASDGGIGRIEGLVVDGADHHVTHVLLADGHLWGAKTVAIPISAVRPTELGVRVDLTKDQIRDLPEIEVDRHE
jgi:sporulation protein YlmC with PRC-barrel domain